jgi:DNA-binding transcriptional LysR family regulator
MNWDDLKIFLAVADAPSMRVAAKNLRVSHSTVSRRIDALEADLGVRLFDRTSDGYRLTRSGDDLMPVALSVEESLHSFGRNVAGRDSDLKGQVCVTVPDVMATSFLMPYFTEFMGEYPDIQLKIQDSFEVFDLSRREADVAIRFTNNPPEHLIGRKLGNVHQAAYATRTYLEKHDPAAPNSTAKWIGWGQPDERPAWVARSPFPHLGVVGHFNNMIIQYQAAKQDVGIGYFSCVQGDPDPDLVRLSTPKPTLDIWLLSHRDLRAAARMRAFRQFITKRQPQLAAALAGQPDRADL